MLDDELGLDLEYAILDEEDRQFGREFGHLPEQPVTDPQLPEGYDEDEDGDFWDDEDEDDDDDDGYDN